MPKIEDDNERKLKVVSLSPKVIIFSKSGGQEEDRAVELEGETIIVAPIFADMQEQVVENISEIVDKVYVEFSSACKRQNLNWEAELEFGLEFGIRFSAKLKIIPKDPEKSPST